MKNSLLKRVEALEAAAAAKPGAARRGIVFVPVRPIASADGRHIGGMVGGRPPFSFDGPETVKATRSSGAPTFRAKPGFTVDEVEARAIDLGLLST